MDVDIIILTGLLTALATARISRLVVEDTLTQPLRDAIARRATPSKGRHAAASKLWAQVAALTSCTWCTSMWVASYLSAGTVAWHTSQWPSSWDTRTWWLWALVTPATSWGASILHDWLDSPPPVRQVSHTPMRLDVALRDQRR